MTKKLLIAGALLAASFQTGWLGLMIESRASHLRSGQEVVLDTGMIDPRDFFRGHYVILRLRIERAPASLLSTLESQPEHRAPIWAELEPTDTAFWSIRALHSTPPAIDAPVLKGTYRGKSSDVLRLDFPIDRFFAPKKQAQELEKFRRDDQLGVILALTKDGAAAIKGITVNGTRFFEEPLY